MAKLIVPKEELADHIGKVVGTSDWFEISQERINAFADATDDWQFIHIDEEKAKETPFGGTIAHGFLTLSLLTPLLEDACIMPEGVTMGVNYGFNKVRFLAPVRAGAEVRVVVTLVDAAEKRPGQFMMTNKIKMEINGEKNSALIAEWVTMLMTGDAA